MTDRLITTARAKELAAKWHSAEGSPLDLFAKSERLAPDILQECRDVYSAPISQSERDEVMQLGVYLAARSFIDSARKEARLRR